MAKSNHALIAKRKWKRLSKMLKSKLPNYETLYQAEHNRIQTLNALKKSQKTSAQKLYAKLYRCEQGKNKPCNIEGCPRCDYYKRALQVFNTRKMLKGDIKAGASSCTINIIPPKHRMKSSELVGLNWATYRNSFYKKLQRALKGTDGYVRLGVDIDRNVNRWRIHFHGVLVARDEEVKKAMIKKLRKSFKMTKAGGATKAIVVKPIHHMEGWLSYTSKTRFNYVTASMKKVVGVQLKRLGVPLHRFLAKMTYRNRFIEVGERHYRSQPVNMVSVAKTKTLKASATIKSKAKKGKAVSKV